MHSYIIIAAGSGKTSYERCGEISEALWTIENPRSVRNADDVSCKFCGIIQHPQDSRGAIIVASDDQIRPHKDLLTQELFDSMPEYTTQKKTAVTTRLAENHGVQIDVGDILPTSFTYMTESDMRSGGWFGSDIP